MKTRNDIHEKYYCHILENISQHHDRSRVFHDFLVIIVCCLSMQQKEDLYHETIKRYKPEEVKAFAKAFAKLVEWMENHQLEDPFGDYFQKSISRGHNGQFFTPPHIADLMAQIVTPIGGESLCDPCCGSGRFILSAAKVNRKLQFVGSDISETCCLMTLVNMCLNDLTGEVRHMNTISMEAWRVWQVRRLQSTGLPYIQELKIVRD